MERKELTYFHSQDVVITLFDALQKNDLAKIYKNEICDIACDLFTKEFIEEIN